MLFNCSSSSSAWMSVCNDFTINETFKDKINLNASEWRAVMMGRSLCLKYRHQVCRFVIILDYMFINGEKEREKERNFVYFMSSLLLY